MKDKKKTITVKLVEDNDDPVMVILAGGLGTRIQHIIGNLPKPMHNVAGRPFLEWLLRYYMNQGIRRFVLSTGYKGETLERHFTSMPTLDSNIICVRENKPLGTAGGFLNAVECSGLSSKRWLVANGDSLLLCGQQILNELRRCESDACLIGLRVADTTRFGSLQITPEGQLVRFLEKRTGSGLVNAGLYAFSNDAINLFPKRFPLSFEYDVFPKLLEQKFPIQVTSCASPFIDIGTETTLFQAESFIRENQSAFLKN